jgi:hypothetical protein
MASEPNRSLAAKIMGGAIRSVLFKISSKIWCLKAVGSIPSTLREDGDRKGFQRSRWLSQVHRPVTAKEVLKKSSERSKHPAGVLIRGYRDHIWKLIPSHGFRYLQIRT